VRYIHISYFFNQSFNAQLLWCKALFCLSDWPVFIPKWRAGCSNSYMMDSLRMTPRATKRIGVAN